MANSILADVKKMVGVAEGDHSFDLEIIIYINMAFFTLTQLGLGPITGFKIDDATATWDDFPDSDAAVQTYIGLKVRQVFDPVMTAHLSTAIKEQIAEFEYRLNLRKETTWTAPVL